MAKRQTKKVTPKVVVTEPEIKEEIEIVSEEIETVEIEQKIKEDFSEILLYDEFHKLIHTTIASKVTFFVDIKGLYKKYIDQCATSNETNDTLVDRGHIINWALKELL